jgi:hypothetical protein
MIPYGIGIHYSIYFVEMTENENNAGWKDVEYM